MSNCSKGLRVIEDFCLSSQPGTLRKKIICTKKVYEIDHAEFVCRFCQLSFLINFNDGVLPPQPPNPHCPLRDGGILILKSSNHSGEELFYHTGGQVHIGNTMIMVTKGGEGA